MFPVSQLTKVGVWSLVHTATYFRYLIDDVLQIFVVFIGQYSVAYRLATEREDT
jgi:hypothetical protein